MGIDFGKMLADVAKGVEDAAKGVADLVDSAGKEITKAVDQNGDGKLDFADIQTAWDNHKKMQAENRRKADFEQLKPLFAEEIEQPEFSLPKLIMVSEIDKLHAENEVCKGSIGFRTVQDDMTAITIFHDHIDDFGLTFYPEQANGPYFVDPCDRDHYISLDEYFLYLKQQRVTELYRIAQTLGAKHFKVTYKERTASSSSLKVDVTAGVKAVPAKVDTKENHSVSNSEMTAISIEAEMKFPGHTPQRPELKYLRNDINILNLIEMRMDPLSPLQHQRFNIEMINSSGIKVRDAVKIDAMLKMMKTSVNVNVVSEAQNEARRVLEYEIEF